jgi:hypothetical protein
MFFYGKQRHLQIAEMVCLLDCRVRERGRMPLVRGVSSSCGAHMKVIHFNLARLIHFFYCSAEGGNRPGHVDIANSSRARIQVPITHIRRIAVTKSLYL